MFEFHGWAVLRWDDSLSGSEEQMAAIQQAADAARSEFSIAEVSRLHNDLTVVHVHGLRNHRVASIQRLFEVVAQEAPQSYGLLYVWDEEDELGFENAFRVWRLARGQFTVMPDPFLSPCVPTIELPYDPERET